MKPQETILIPIKASKDLPKDEELYICDVMVNDEWGWAVLKYVEGLWQDVYKWQFDSGDIITWYKPISKKEYDRQVRENRICEWRYDEDFDYYATQCGSEYSLIDGTLEENEYYYCPFCGGKINHIKDQLK